MSVESQSEDIWRYAMRPTPVIGDASNEPLSPGDDASGPSGGGTVTPTDLSEDIGSIPSQFNFHGLVPTQSQSQSAWPLDEKAESDGVGRTESQKENMQLSIQSGSRSPLLSAPPSNLDTRKTIIGGTSNKAPSSHVTSHVTGASLVHADTTLPPMDSTNASAPFSSTSLIKGSEPAARATPLKLNNRTVTFPSLPAPPSPSPLTVSRIKSMPPPRLNRYAPRNVHPSSQDSFAGPSVVQDLNEFARNSRILNNTFIRRSETGEVEAVFHRPSHFSSNSPSEPVADEVMSVSQSEQPDATTASQIIRAAFDPSLSPPRPDPVVLVRDSQSDHHSQDSEYGIEARDLSLSSGSYQLPSSDADMVATQPNTQNTEQNIQPTQSVLLATSPYSASTDTGGPSPLPVPLHRRRQFAALEAARLRARDEVVPETPQSTVAPTVQASAPPPVCNDEGPSDPGKDAKVKASNDENSARGKEKEKDAPARIIPDSRPLSTNTSPSNHHAQVEAPSIDAARHRAVNAPEHPSEAFKGALSVQLPIKYRPPGSEVVPDSQDEEQHQGPDGTRPVSRGHKPGGEIVPDSQEDHQANLATTSSPAVPLRDRYRHRSANDDPPAPTPVAAKSLLGKGKLPESVTHTRGRLKETKGKGKGKAKFVESEHEAESPDKNHDTTPVQQDADMIAVTDIDKEESPLEVSQTVRAYKGKRAAKRSTKKPAATTSSKQDNKRRSAMAAAVRPGPSTRSKKRKSDTPVELTEDNKATPTSPARLPKRQRTIKPLTPAPVTSLMHSTRVFARRADKNDYYFPGTVNVMVASAASSRASTLFRVKFDDGLEHDVDVQCMRRFELENSDNVHIKWPAKHKDCAAEVISTEQWDRELVDVQELGRGPDGDDFEVSSKFLSIPEARIRQQFSERRISSRLLHGDLDFDVPFDIPTKNEHLAGMGFVITLPDLPRGKRSLQKLIVASGGVVFEEWKSLISLDGTVGSHGRRMSGATSKVRMKKDLPGQLFCLADEARTTPKYLIALALGVPCLSFKWVLEKASKPDNEHKVDWPAYVLPAGYNSTTRMPASQAFARAWWRTPGNTPNLISDPPTFKPFLGKSFLCFGTKEFLFAQSELGIFPKILLAMGASYVEAVTDFTHLNKPPARFDYTVVDDGETLLEYKSALPVDVWWIKKCLITGIEGPVPWPDP